MGVPHMGPKRACLLGCVSLVHDVNSPWMTQGGHKETGRHADVLTNPHTHPCLMTKLTSHGLQQTHRHGKYNQGYSMLTVKVPGHEAVDVDVI